MKEETYKKIITKQEYLQIEGLMALAHQAYRQMEMCDKAMRNVLKMRGGYSSSCGLLSDAYFEESYDTKETLKNMGITIK